MNADQAGVLSSSAMAPARQNQFNIPAAPNFRLPTAACFANTYVFRRTTLHKTRDRFRCLDRDATPYHARMRETSLTTRSAPRDTDCSSERAPWLSRDRNIGKARAKADPIARPAAFDRTSPHRREN